MSFAGVAWSSVVCPNYLVPRSYIICMSLFFLQYVEPTTKLIHVIGSCEQPGLKFAFLGVHRLPLYLYCRVQWETRSTMKGQRNQE